MSGTGIVVRQLLCVSVTQADHCASIDSDESVIIVKSEREEPGQGVEMSLKGKWKEVADNGKLVITLFSDSD
jgi:hypothetical protein